MKAKEVKYYNSDEALVREKLMVRRIIDGKETIEEADFSCLAKNIEELYFLALQGKRISTDILRIWRKTNQFYDILELFRSGKNYDECIQQIRTEFNTSKEIAEYIADMRFEQLTRIQTHNLIKAQQYYEKAVTCLKPLIDMNLDPNDLVI